MAGSTKFVFTGLEAPFRQARRSNDPTVAFELTEGAGRFVFLLFCAPEDVGDAHLFIYLPRVDKVLSLKIYGKVWDGQFGVYFNDDQIADIKAELGLGEGRGGFDFLAFAERLNQMIPANLAPAAKLRSLREVWPRAGEQLRSYVDDCDKTMLTGVMHLPPGKKPRDKTLRKLYLFTRSDADAIDDFIQRLRERNVTLVWDVEPPGGRNDDGASFAELISRI